MDFRKEGGVIGFRRALSCENGDDLLMKGPGSIYREAVEGASGLRDGFKKKNKSKHFLRAGIEPAT